MSKAPQLSAVLSATRLTDLPLLTTRRACVLADCSRSTLQRSGIAPVGKRGKTFVWSTDSILKWMTSGLDTPSNDDRAEPAKRSAGSTSDALARLNAIRRGAR